MTRDQQTPAEPVTVWAIVELKGHLRVAGKLTEVERFGSKLGRIDIPMPDGSFVTKEFHGSSLYAITYVDEAAARAVAARNSVEPVHSWELPKQIAAPAAVRESGEYDAPPRFHDPDHDEG